MPNHPPKTLSHEKVLIIVEHLKNIDERGQRDYITWEMWQNLLEDNDRCIQILESEDEC